VVIVDVVVDVAVVVVVDVVVVVVAVVAVVVVTVVVVLGMPSKARSSVAIPAPRRIREKIEQDTKYVQRMRFKNLDDKFLNLI